LFVDFQRSQTFQSLRQQKNKYANKQILQIKQDPTDHFVRLEFKTADLETKENENLNENKIQLSIKERLEMFSKTMKQHQRRLVSSSTIHNKTTKQKLFFLFFLN
jgi:HrpA-like RNA helicase